MRRTDKQKGMSTLRRGTGGIFLLLSRPKETPRLTVSPVVSHFPQGSMSKCIL